MPTRILLQILILATFGSTWSAPKGRSGKPPLAAQSGAPSSLGAPLPLDQEVVAKYYNEGDFDPSGGVAAAVRWTTPNPVFSGNSFVP